ncbi:MAG: SigB/SigF/SigG family RNA polymerase sigma factor [Candidatus Eremiobacteraeota bacterium]|nr:SigB/SigF/SigG family RNA polymerase sigma factor [Candidatus Eremiobacteraeota bacterium]
MASTSRHPRADFALDRAHAKALLAEFAQTRSPEVREQLVVAYTGVVRYLASRFAYRGEPLEDLIQVGMVGLLKAIDRFDASRGFEFITFAMPTIVGEIKRHFRDKGWALHVPRKLQDLNLAVTRTAEALTVELGRSATVDDIASRLGVSSEQVIEAQELGRAYTTYSLDADASATDHHAKPTSLAERIGIADGDMASFENIASLKRACEVLDPTERLVVYLRFYEEVPQTEIARRLGVSQMNISRVQRRAIKKIRASLFDEADVVTRGAVS